MKAVEGDECSCFCAYGSIRVPPCAERSGGSRIQAPLPCLQAGAFHDQILCPQNTQCSASGGQGLLGSLWTRSSDHHPVSTVRPPAVSPWASGAWELTGDLVRLVHLHLRCLPRGRSSGRVGEIVSMRVEGTSDAVLKEFCVCTSGGGWVEVLGFLLELGTQAVGGRAGGEAGSAE